MDREHFREQGSYISPEENNAYMQRLMGMYGVSWDTPLEKIKPIVLPLLDSPLTWWDGAELIYGVRLRESDKEIKSILESYISPQEKLERLVEVVEI
ncbi:hypothetical protein A2115_00365 [Candidatus Woesebacteria bacterium GWA1_41_8]|uniref:Uncharacterized protein n=1 Tax=Candidatus Woesebacteria bacterium GWA1_41_8 TaxID=1802471 RepID=A0A1F7WHL9_9BACT|nr:MAG: hypothetical protein A2115_00365 [Candidatus Woesebacteria bacterium GWA1_41_8]